MLSITTANQQWIFLQQYFPSKSETSIKEAFLLRFIFRSKGLFTDQFVTICIPWNNGRLPHILLRWTKLENGSICQGTYYVASRWNLFCPSTSCFIKCHSTRTGWVHFICRVIGKDSCGFPLFFLGTSFKVYRLVKMCVGPLQNFNKCWYCVFLQFVFLSSISRNREPHKKAEAFGISAPDRAIGFWNPSSGLTSKFLFSGCYLDTEKPSRGTSAHPYPARGVDFS